MGRKKIKPHLLPGFKCFKYELLLLLRSFSHLTCVHNIPSISGREFINFNSTKNRTLCQISRPILCCSPTSYEKSIFLGTTTRHACSISFSFWFRFEVSTPFLRRVMVLKYMVMQPLAYPCQVVRRTLPPQLHGASCRRHTNNHRQKHATTTSAHHPPLQHGGKRILRKKKKTCGTRVLRRKKKAPSPLKPTKMGIKQCSPLPTRVIFFFGGIRELCVMWSWATV